MENPPLSQLVNVPIEQIKPSPFQARKTFDAGSLKSLADTIKEQGLISPITVRQIPGTPISYELIAGERRLRAVKMLGWSSIPAYVQEGVSDQDAAVKGLIENMQREDLNPIERGAGYKKLSEPPFNLSHESIAKMVGSKNNETISRHIALLQMPSQVQDLLSRDSITERHARAIRTLTDPGQQIAMAQQAAQEGWSVKETEKRIKQLLAPSPASTTHPLPAGRGRGAASGEGSKEDPLADFWATNPLSQSTVPPGTWGVAFGKHPTLPQPAWTFWVLSMGMADKVTLHRWAKALSDSLEKDMQAQQTKAAMERQ
jgi:ParB family chromosome partitioning protein